VKKPKQRTASVSASEHGRAQAMIEQLQARSITVRAAWLTTWTKSYCDPQERSEIRNQIREWQAGR